MQKVKIMILMLFLVAACKPVENFDSFCATKVILNIENLEESYSNLCFSEKKEISFILSNGGKVDIEKLKIEIYDEEKTDKFDMNVKIPEGGTKTVRLNLNKYGNIKYIIIYPYVTYDNETKICEKNKKFLANLPVC